MNREVHVRFRERLRGKFPRATRPGININGKNRWLHCVSSPLWTLYYAHEKRGLEAMESLPLLTLFSGILVHDHWKPYFKLFVSMPYAMPITYGNWLLPMKKRARPGQN